jgi:16S rRNA (guanine527-N7)-methyltransferase
MSDPGHRLDQFADLVLASPHNLVSRRARAELRERHVQESAAFAATLPAGPLRVLDVGSGGGFPGLVIAIVRPDLQVELLEATGKKVEFLQEAAETLGLEVTVHHGRAEELRQGPLAGQFDLCTARAVAPLDRLIGWTVPFLKPGGFLYAIKGDRWEEELEQATTELRQWDAVVAATPRDLAGVGAADAPAVVIIRRVPDPA